MPGYSTVPLPPAKIEDPIWRISSPQPLSIRCWDGDYAVYNPLSGNTHILDILSGEVLRTIVAGNSRSGELIRRVAEFLEIPADDQTCKRLDEILQELDELGLIEQVPEC